MPQKLLFFHQKKEAKKIFPRILAVLFSGSEVFQFCSMAYSLSEALNVLENGNFHALAYVSIDKKRNEGGRIIRIDAGRIVRHENKQNDDCETTNATKNKKATQRHSMHATRNIRLKNNQIRKMHIHTLFMVNNQPIL